MMTIRQNVFETNSSSTHSITICSRKQFDAWTRGLCRFDAYSGHFSELPTDDFYKDLNDRAVIKYKETKEQDPYVKKWEELDDKCKERFIQQFLKSELFKLHEDFGYTYDEYRYSYQSSCEYTEKFFTTEHGDEVVAFGKGGYDG